MYTHKRHDTEVKHLQLESLLGKRLGVKAIYRWEDNTNVVFEQIDVLCFERQVLRRIIRPVYKNDGRLRCSEEFFWVARCT
jgi:hypothetical protein